MTPLYRKNKNFSFLKLKCKINKIDKCLSKIKKGVCFKNIAKNQVVDIIEINYFWQKTDVYIIVHYAIVDDGI